MATIHPLAHVLLAALAAPAASQVQVPYALDEPSDYSQGCWPPCACPIQFADDLTGTFRLSFTHSDPAGYDHYDVLTVDWRYTLGGTHSLIGTGHYRRGGAVAVQEQLELFVSLDGGAVEHYDSGLVTPQAQFPRIDILASKNGMVCYDQVFHVDATPREPGAGFCSGDGTASPCPCGNAGGTGRGCANSVAPAGALLTATGVASLAADDVVLHSSATPDSSVLFFQGTQRVAGGNGVAFGDGLRCAGGTLTRLRTVAAAGGEARVPGPTDPRLSVLGGITSPGTFTYQAWYRNAAAFCTPATFNLTNGYEIVWS